MGTFDHCGHPCLLLADHSIVPFLLRFWVLPSRLVEQMQPVRINPLFTSHLLATLSRTHPHCHTFFLSISLPKLHVPLLTTQTLSPCMPLWSCMSPVHLFSMLVGILALLLRQLNPKPSLNYGHPSDFVPYELSNTEWLVFIELLQTIFEIVFMPNCFWWQVVF